MSYTTEELTRNVKDSIGQIMAESVEYFKEGRKKAAWSTVDHNLNTGRIMLVQWPNDIVVNVHWSPEPAGYGDLGTLIGAVSTEYFGIDTTVELLVTIIQKFMEE